MPFLIEYFLKLSICLAAVYLFYQLVLRRLTFYHWNRWYLLGYTILAFVIPFINISAALEGNQLEDNYIIRFIPSVKAYTAGMEISAGHSTGLANLDSWDWCLLVLFCGTGLLLVKFLTRFLSFVKMRRNSILLSDNGMKIYQVHKNIIPFSFGNSIFINKQLHTDAELEEIIRHEFVHIKQKHTHDIIWCELLCILNWYNPFAWLIRNSVRQNLEFIADHKVLENGLSKKQYQYLLLKVIGNNHFSIANQFNFSSLKKRIAMMNKMKSARPHLLKFLFILPVIAVLLLAFRNENKIGQSNEQQIEFVQEEISQPEQTDTTPPPQPSQMPANVRSISINNSKAIVILKNGEKETYDFNDDDAKEAFEKKYGKMPSPPTPPQPADAPTAPPAPPSPPVLLPANVSSMHIDDNEATVILKDGSREKYNLKNDRERKSFEKKYGNMSVPPTPPLPPVKVVGVETSVGSTRAITGSANTNITQNADISLVNENGVTVHLNAPAIYLSPIGSIAEGEKILELKINKSFSNEKLNNLIEEAKAKGVKLEFEKIVHNSKSEISSLSGTLKKEGSKSTFTISGFEVITLLVIRQEGDKISCLVYSNKDREEI